MPHLAKTRASFISCMGIKLITIMIDNRSNINKHSNTNSNTTSSSNTNNDTAPGEDTCFINTH